MNGHCRVAVCILSAAAGCSSAPIRYYTLTPPPGAAASATKTNVIVDVRVVHIPPQLNRTELMVRTGSAEIALLENERWASPVKDEIKDALRLELQRRLSVETGLLPPIDKLTVTIDVQHFEAELGRHALMEASWSLALAHGSETAEGWAATCPFHGDEKIAAGYAAMVSGYQRDINALADAVVAELKHPARAIEAPCGQPGRS